MPDAQWEVAIGHYDWDHMAEAYAAAVDAGIEDSGEDLFWFRLIEAEWTTRRRARIDRVADWLEIEWIEAEAPRPFKPWISRAVRAMDEVARRLRWEHAAPTRVAILAEETDAPWAAHPYGYCADKHPYEKICLPPYLYDEPDEFSQAVAHEYAHVISLNLTQGLAPAWLEETISVLAERNFDDQALAEFRSGQAPWLTPSELEGAFGVDLDPSEDDEDRSWLAYQQAGLIGRYLMSLGPEERLADLLRAHVGLGALARLRSSLGGASRTDAALRNVYGLGERELFERARDWVFAKPSL